MIRSLFSSLFLFFTLISLPAQKSPDFHLESGFVLRLSAKEWTQGLQLVTDSGRLYGWMFRIMDSQGTWSAPFYWDMGQVLESSGLFTFPVISDLLTIIKSSDQGDPLYVQLIVPGPGNPGYYEPWSGRLSLLKVQSVPDAALHP